MTWRDMTRDELATRAEARLGGGLLWMVTVAAAIAAAVALGAVLEPQRLTAVGRRYTIAVAFIGGWSTLFVVLTLLRARATPLLASAGLVLWIGWRLLAAIASAAGWPLLVDLLGEALLAVGFCAYMAAGVRPNAYYRRRLPANGGSI